MLRFTQVQIFNKFFGIRYRDSKTLTTKVHIMTENNKIDNNQCQKRVLDDENEKENETKKQKTESFLRIKKRNYAIILGYLGTNYYGMQRNPGMNTIEEEFIKALFKADLINSEAFETIQNINFQRAARTDKGVSAGGQVVSLRLPENICKDDINKNLPDDIKVFDVKRVTKGFNSKSQCDARTYSYTMPTFALAPENLELFPETAECLDIEKRIEQLSIIDGIPYEDYRLPQDRQQRLKEILKLYEGTHHFHNFTSKIFPLDPRGKRYIMNFIAEEPFVVNNMEFITLKVKGQSFMMHQIRKMVALVIGILRNILKEDVFDQVFDRHKYDIARAPSLGLMLNIVHYEYYNNRYGSDGVHEKLDWTEWEEVNEFTKNKILTHMIDTELKEKSMLNWLASLRRTSFGLRDENKSDIKDDVNNEKLNGIDD